VNTTGSKLTVVNQGSDLKMRSLVARVNGIRQAQTVATDGGYISETASGTFLIFSLTVTNRLDQPIEVGGVGTSLTALVLDNDKQYDEDFDASNQALQTSFLSRDAPVQPDETATGEVVFDLPAKALRRVTKKGAALVVAPLGEDVNDDLKRAGIIRIKALGA
jgi:hypothetical protein